MESRWVRRALFVLALLGGVISMFIAATGTVRDAMRTGLIVAGAVALVTVGWTLLTSSRAHDPGRRRFLG
ncbi:MAG: hypothetical protein H0W82_06045, partial [Actinobacteria bacterium]|nr:hypothetical protein [Actinomycetota bacterium]